jgi:hypothetical protein
MTRRLPALGALIVGLAVGVVLVVTGGSDETAGPTTTTSVAADAAAPADPATDTQPLPLDDTSQQGIESLSGLVLPDGVTDFLTARLDDDRQLDVTFQLPADGVDAFLRDSGLPDLAPDQRVVIHSSPLWKLNPDEGTTLVGGTDRYGDIARAVELLTAPDGTVRARVVITSAV